MKLFRNVRLQLLSSSLVVFLVVSCLGRTAFALCTTPLTKNHDVTARGFPPHPLGRPRTRTNLDATSSTNSNNLVRGERYKSENSTLPSPEIIAAKLGVQPTREASPKTWKRAWKLHKRLIPLLHSTDGCKPPDSSLNLACMWWKGLSGNDGSSPVYDNGLAYDLLPSGWRRIIRPRRLYPRLHHGNVELRTAYLDGQISEIAKTIKEQQPITGDDSNSSRNDATTTKIRLVCMGAGYDTRGVKMMERETVDQVIELDLPEVVDAKERLFRRLLKRRPWLKELSMPTLVPSDFNDLSDVEEKLKPILRRDEDEDDTVEWHTIFVFEGVMIYLNDNVPSSLLNITSRLLRENNRKGSLCFADRLENVPGGDFDMGVKELETNGWNLKDWSPKPGLARHMGSASLSTSTTTVV